MVKVIAIEGRDEERTIREFYTSPTTFCVAVSEFHKYKVSNPYWVGVPYIEIDGVKICDDDMEEYFKGCQPTIKVCELILNSLSDAMMKQQRMGQGRVWESTEREVDKGFLAGYFGGEKKEDSPYYNQGYQSGIKCAAKGV